MIWSKILGLLLSVGVVLLTLKLLLCIAIQDKEGGCYSRKMTPGMRLLCLGSGEAAFMSVWGYLQDALGDDVSGRNLFLTYAACILMSILAGSLLMACVTDCQNCLVYHFVWWVGGIGGMGGLVVSVEVLWGAGASLLVFGLFLVKMFSRMYGRADCHAFLVCAFAECAMGLRMKEYLLHMLLALLLLIVVQAMQKNIRNDGNLIEAVPFLPYITVSFWLVLIMSELSINFLYIYSNNVDFFHEKCYIYRDLTL